MLAVFTLLSVPAYVLFWAAGKHKSNSSHTGETEESLSFSDALFGLSLGNLGDKESFILTLNPAKTVQKVSMFCNTGVIGSVTKLGYAKDKSDGTGAASYVTSTWCELEPSAANASRFRKKCYDNQYCKIKFDLDFDTEVRKVCQNQEIFPATADLQKSYKIYVEYDCDVR
mmetsp:Transcript_10771/g.13486  ORF Transcript_10771/g.13486 Transcript_10771/m.13486 type:complete len:171 (+) Transcript_10771:938-1450(+)